MKISGNNITVELDYTKNTDLKYWSDVLYKETPYHERSIIIEARQIQTVDLKLSLPVDIRRGGYLEGVGVLHFRDELPIPDKRYLVFIIEEYEASGGMYDLSNSFDNYKEAKEYSERQDCKDKHIYDRLDGVIL